MKKNTKRNKKSIKPVAVLDLTNLTSAEDFYNRTEAFAEEHGIATIMPETEIRVKKESILRKMWKGIKKFFKK